MVPRAEHPQTVPMWTARAMAVVIMLLTGVIGIAGAAAEGVAAVGDADSLGAGPGAFLAFALALGGTLVGLGWALVGAVLVWFRPANLVGWMLLAVGALAQLTMTEGALNKAGRLAAGPLGGWNGGLPGAVLALVAGWAILTMLGILPAIYPDGILPARRGLWPLLVVAVGAALAQLPALAGAFASNAGQSPSTDPSLLATLVYFSGAAVVWLMSIVRLLRSPPPKRQQLAWLLGSVVLLLVVSLLGDAPVAQVLQITSLYLLPLAIAIGLLRYRLLGLDAAPRADPMRTVTQIGSQVASTEEGELLGAVLASVQRSVGAPGARVRDQTGAVAASSGKVDPPAFTADLAVGGVPVGVLEVAARWPGDRYGSKDERMLRTLAAQLAAVVRAQRLTEQVEAQRDAVIDARLLERKRMRQELHDGLGPALTGMCLGLDGLTDALRAQDTARSLEIAMILRAEVAVTVSEVRRVIDDLHPAALEEAGGFAEAIRRSVVCVAANIPVEIRVDPLPALPLVVEQAAYRVAGEAVTNAVRHALASRLAVTVGARDEQLTPEGWRRRHRLRQ